MHKSAYNTYVFTQTRTCVLYVCLIDETRKPTQAAANFRSQRQKHRATRFKHRQKVRAHKAAWLSCSFEDMSRWLRVDDEGSPFGTICDFGLVKCRMCRRQNMKLLTAYTAQHSCKPPAPVHFCRCVGGMPNGSRTATKAVLLGVARAFCLALQAPFFCASVRQLC